MFMTQLVENRNQAEKFEARKDLLANITLFDGKDKKLCLMWLKQAETDCTKHQNHTQGGDNGKSRNHRHADIIYIPHR